MRDAPTVRSAREILDEIDRRDISRTDVANVLGISQPNATKLWKPDSRTNKTRALSLDEANALIEAFKLFTNEDGSTRPPAIKESDQPVFRTADAGETVEIIQLDLSLPMGSGATVDDYIEEEPRVFDLAYIRGFTRTPPHRLRIARGVGDSMFPTLQSADMVWIDSTQTTLNQADRIWAVSINGAAAIKRLRRMKPGRVLVVSDNPAVENYEVDEEDIRIGGRVIRFARDV